MFTLQPCAFYILSTLHLFVSIPRAAFSVSKACASELKYSTSSSSPQRPTANVANKIGMAWSDETILQIENLDCYHFGLIWMIFHGERLVGAWFFLMGQFSWLQFESLNQSVNHRRKGFQRHFDSSWNTSRYIFHKPDQPLKSLSFDINSLSNPHRPWAVHLHAGRAGRFIHCQSSFILNAPGTSQFSSSAHQTTHQLDKYRRVIKHHVLCSVSLHAAREQQACKTAWRSHLESWNETSGEFIASCSHARDLSSPLHFPMFLCEEKKSSRGDLWIKSKESVLQLFSYKCIHVVMRGVQCLYKVLWPH